MIPKSILNSGTKVVNEVGTTKTYKLSKSNIQGYTDNLEALQQAIYKLLNTEKYEYPIYSFGYGIDTESFIGKDPIYVKIELKRQIQENLLQDERIINVDNFSFAVNGDELTCTFEVNSIYGEITIQKEVTI